MEPALVTGLVLLAPTMTTERPRRPRFADPEEIHVVEEVQLEARSLPSSPRRLAPRRVRLDRVAPASPIARTDLFRFYDCINLPTTVGSEFEKPVGKRDKTSRFPDLCLGMFRRTGSRRS